MNDKLATIEAAPISVYDEPLPVKEVLAQVGRIQGIMKEVMKVDVHYGVIPGCGKKPALLKAGAEKLSLTFRLLPSYDVRQTDLPGGHREYHVTCTLSGPDGGFRGEGVGSCSTMESKYRYRDATRLCPECGSSAIIKGKEEYGGGFLCYAKKGGCGAKFADNDLKILNQPLGKIDNMDLADQFNTVLKMAKKRAHIDAVITATGTSDIFAQDIDDNPDAFRRPGERIVADKEPEPARQPPPPRQAPPPPPPKRETKPGQDSLGEGPPLEAYGDQAPPPHQEPDIRDAEYSDTSTGDRPIEDVIADIDADGDGKLKFWYGEGGENGISRKQAGWLYSEAHKAGVKTDAMFKSKLFDIAEPDDWKGGETPEINDISVRLMRWQGFGRIKDAFVALQGGKS